MSDSPARSALIAAFAAIYLIWGSTFLALRYAVEAVPPLVSIAVRCVFGALILYGWLAARGSLEPSTARRWAMAAVAGAFLFIGGHAILASVEQRMPSGRAALLLTTIPLWLAVLEAGRTRRLPPVRVMVGLVGGMGGVAMLTSGPAGTATLLDHLLLLFGALAWAAGSLVARHGLAGTPALQSTAMQLAAGGVFVVAGSVLTGELSNWSPADVTPRAGAALAYLVIAGTVIGFAAYTWLLRVTSSHAVGTYAFVNPVVALALAWAVGDERASWLTAAAAVLIIGSVIVTRGASAPPARAPISLVRVPGATAIHRPLEAAPHAYRPAPAHLERVHDGRVVLASPGRHAPADRMGDPDQLGDRAGRILFRRSG